MPPTTIKQLLQQAYKRIDPLDAELLLAFVLKKPRESVIAHPERRVNKCVSAQVCKLVKKRCAGVPLAYLTGRKEFFGLDFVVDRHVLIPRPETEVLVESVLSCIMYHVTHNKRVVLIDVGTGSGCIPIVIAKTMKQSDNGTIKTFAIDISKSALRIAKLNAKKHGTKIKFLHGNLLTPVAHNRTMGQWGNSPIIITANLPYLTKRQYGQKPSHKYEPKQALIAGKTGLELYEKLLQQIRSLISSFYFLVSIFLEIDPSQSKSMAQLIKKHLPNAKVQIKKDLANLDRVVTVQT